MQNLYTEKYKILYREIKDLNKWSGKMFMDRKFPWYYDSNPP